MIKSRLKSFQFAFQGLSDLFRTQPNTKIHLLAAAGVLAGGVYF